MVNVFRSTWGNLQHVKILQNRLHTFYDTAKEIQDEEKRGWIALSYNNNLYICIERRKAVKEVIATRTMATYSQKHAGLYTDSPTILMNDEKKLLFDRILNHVWLASIIIDVEYGFHLQKLSFFSLRFLFPFR